VVRFILSNPHNSSYQPLVGDLWTTLPIRYYYRRLPDLTPTRFYNNNCRYVFRPVRLRKNLHTAMESQVLRILIDPNTKKAYGVLFLRNGVKQIVYARKEVILSAGAVNSPQLLMLSGVGPKEQLRKFKIPVVQDLQVQCFALTISHSWAK